MLEMAGGAICLSTMGLKIGNCVCSADKWRRAVRYVRATTEQPIWSKKEESTPMLYGIGQGFHNRTHALYVESIPCCSCCSWWSMVAQVHVKPSL